MNSQRIQYTECVFGGDFMISVSTDRTPEQEQRLQAIRVRSEDTCCFWERKRQSGIIKRQCFYCEHYRPGEENGYTGVCGYKVSPQR